MYNYNPYNSFNPYAQVHIGKVHGIEEAKAYPLAPNSDVLLMNDTGDVVYFKMTDAGGFPTVKAFQLTEIDEKPRQDRLEEICSRLDSIEKRLNDVNSGNAEHSEHGK